MNIPVYPVQTNAGVKMGAMAVAAAAAPNARTLDLRDLPRAPQLNSPAPR